MKYTITGRNGDQVAVIEIDPCTQKLIDKLQGTFVLDGAGDISTGNWKNRTKLKKLIWKLREPSFNGAVHFQDGNKLNLTFANMTQSFYHTKNVEKLTINSFLNTTTPTIKDAGKPTGDNTIDQYGQIIDGKFYSHEWLKQRQAASQLINSGCSENEHSDDIEC